MLLCMKSVYWDECKQNTCSYNFHHPFYRGLACLQTRMVWNGTGIIIVKSVDFAVVPAFISAVNHVLSTCMHQVALELYYT